MAIESRNVLPNMYNRVLSMLHGEKPDRIPFIDRMELWYSAHTLNGTIPDKYKDDTSDAGASVMSLFAVPIAKGTRDMTLGRIHRDLGFGQQIQMICHGRRLRGVEIKLELNGKTYHHEKDPCIDYLPRMFTKLVGDRPGETVATISTPAGRLTARSALNSAQIATGATPIMTEHPVKEIDDFKVIEYIFEKSEFVPHFDEVQDVQDKLGDIGFVAPMMNRIPFQQLALDFVGETQFFYMLYDHPDVIDRMLALIDQVLQEDIKRLGEFPWPYIQFDDNLDGVIANPKLFPKYCLPYYQRYTELLHAQGKKVGSHTDGNLKPLLDFLPETGLDVCESFSPAPLTDCEFDDAWHAFRERGPMIWGGIPSTILEESVSEEEFRRYVDHVFQMIADHPIILGIGDMVMSNNLIDRVRYIAERVEEHEIGKHWSSQV